MKIIIYSKKKIFLQLLDKYITMNLLKKDTRDESEEIIVIENISNLQQMHLGYYLENNVVLIDCSLKEEFEHMEKVVNEIFYNNKTILAHIIVLNDLYYDSSEKFHNLKTFHMCNDLEELKKIVENIIYGDNIKKQKERINGLTKREQEILIMIAKGMLNKEIADELSITERTVKNHISNLFKKIDVYDRTQAAVYAIKNKIYNI